MAALNIAFWAVGILLFWAALPRFHGGAVAILGSSTTIHAAISKLHSAPILRPITAAMTIFAFAGLAVFEVVWGAYLFKALFPGDSVTPIYYIVVAAITAYLVVYISVGGQLASIQTDQIQLVVGYLGLHGMLAWLLLEKGATLGKSAFPWLALIVVAASVLAVGFRILSAKALKSSKLMSALNALSIASFLILIYSIIKSTPSLTGQQVAINIPEIIGTPNFWWIFAFFVTLPLCFQFVDTSNWQRLASLKYGDAEAIREARKGLLQYAIESPLSWLIPVALGICVLQVLTFPPPSGVDPWVYLLQSILAAPGPLGSLLAILGFSGIAAIFLSTAEGLLTAIGWAWSYDINSKSRRVVDRHLDGSSVPQEDVWLVIGAGRTAILATMFILVALFIAFDLYEEGGGQRLLGIFMAFYSPMVALAPSLLVPALFGRACSPRFAIASVLLGSSLGVLCGFLSLVVKAPTNELFQWLSAPIAFAASWVVYILGVIFAGHSIKQTDRYATAAQAAKEPELST